MGTTRRRCTVVLRKVSEKIVKNRRRLLRLVAKVNTKNMGRLAALDLQRRKSPSTSSFMEVVVLELTTSVKAKAKKFEQKRDQSAGRNARQIQLVPGMNSGIHQKAPAKENGNVRS